MLATNGAAAVAPGSTDGASLSSEDYGKGHVGDVAEGAAATRSEEERPPLDGWSPAGAIQSPRFSLRTPTLRTPPPPSEITVRQDRCGVAAVEGGAAPAATEKRPLSAARKLPASLLHLQTPVAPLSCRSSDKKDCADPGETDVDLGRASPKVHVSPKVNKPSVFLRPVMWSVRSPAASKVGQDTSSADNLVKSCIPPLIRLPFARFSPVALVRTPASVPSPYCAGISAADQRNNGCESADAEKDDHDIIVEELVASKKKQDDGALCEFLNTADDLFALEDDVMEEMVESGEKQPAALSKYDQDHHTLCDEDDGVQIVEQVLAGTEEIVVSSSKYFNSPANVWASAQGDESGFRTLSLEDPEKDQKQTGCTLLQLVADGARRSPVFTNLSVMDTDENPTSGTFCLRFPQLHVFLKRYFIL